MKQAQGPISINPATGDILKNHTLDSWESVVAKISLAQVAFEKGKKISIQERILKLKKISDILKSEKNNFAKLITEEMGKPLKQSVSEIEKCALNCDFVAEKGPKWLSPQDVKTEALKSYLSFEPMGVILAIMPWNFPFWQAWRFLASTLIAGNTVVLKHAENSQLAAQAIQQIAERAGFPKGSVINVCVKVADVAKIIEHPFIKGVTLTGSERAGKSVASIAGNALKKCVLELGGSDPFIVFDDCNFDKMMEAAVTSRTGNAGQACNSAKRFIVMENIADKFVAEMKKRFEALVMGDPQIDATTLGPMARLDLRDGLHKQVESYIAQGATLVTGGKIPLLKGFFYPATLIDHCKVDSPITQEELFGPVAPIFRVKNEEEALHVANSTPYGLGASIWTKDLSRAERMIPQIESGLAFVNGVVRSDPRLPFGGIKLSGYGKELSSYGMHEFVNMRTIVLNEA